MAGSFHIPRLLIAATSSGAGKTTVTAGLLIALRARGLKVAAFKCGPDYLDPTYHERVAGRPAQNLDGWMMGREAVLATFVRAARGADVAVIEGMMGLYDGATPTGEEGSTAEIAKWLDAPVILVVDAGGMARSVAAVAEGFAHFDPALKLAGLICNRIGGTGHLELLRAASREVPVMGGLPLNAEIRFPERHLGLLAADEATVPDAVFDSLGRLAATALDLDLLLATARAAPSLEQVSVDAPRSVRRCRIGLAFDAAFHFYYADNLCRLEAAGAELVRFAPTRDLSLPDVDGLYFGGGYPETMAEELSANTSMLDALREFAGRGGPIYAECGGLMYLVQGIRTLDGKLWPMAGLLAGEAVMCPRLQALGYVEVETNADSIIGPAGTRFRGHQFRYSTLTRAEPCETIYAVHPRWGGAPFSEGYRRANLLASYVHAHWALNPEICGALVRACEVFALRRRDAWS